MANMERVEQIGIKITRELRNHFSYPDPISAQVERDYYGSGLKLRKDFTGFVSRRERLGEQQNSNTVGIANTSESTNAQE